MVEEVPRLGDPPVNITPAMLLLPLPEVGSGEEKMLLPWWEWAWL
jgi:hypothetical protein